MEEDHEETSQWRRIPVSAQRWQVGRSHFFREWKAQMFLPPHSSRSPCGSPTGEPCEIARHLDEQAQGNRWNLIDHREYEHASVPSTVENLWGLPSMTDRDNHARNLSSLLTLSSPRLDTPQFLPPATGAWKEANTYALQAIALRRRFGKTFIQLDFCHLKGEAYCLLRLTKQTHSFRRPVISCTVFTGESQ